MIDMFYNATSFNNGGDSSISGWTTSAVTSMGQMFSDASSFNQDINSWNVSNVNSMVGMFFNATQFNQNLSSWCVSSFPTKPFQFDTGALSWVGGNATRPQWGTCP
jgi:surface protein